jgi:hypothetical protein
LHMKATVLPDSCASSSATSRILATNHISDDDPAVGKGRKGGWRKVWYHRAKSVCFGGLK